IIFTSWTRTLDLLEMYLQQANLDSQHFKRIDGGCPTAKRERILHEFASDSQLRILIMTTGTGAVGLNLATANRVFIVEPQWNPSVENQAIARALRLGQKQPVLVTRYVVDQTVELVGRRQNYQISDFADYTGYADATGEQAGESKPCQKWMIRFTQPHHVFAASSRWFVRLPNRGG
ncbi:P-loop containing nucleoside triphosphate hydrolase protein, partial [Pyrenochaeta sp. MPI-SDFR-AT-0127]